MAALLEEIGGREIDGDATRRQAEPDGGQRGPHPLAALAHRLVGHAHQREGPHPARRHLHLDVDLQHLDALEGHRLDPRHHWKMPPGSRPTPATDHRA